MTEKVFKEFIARLEEASICFQIHKSDEWLNEIEKSRDLLLNSFKEKSEKVEELQTRINKVTKLCSVNWINKILNG